MRVSHHDKSVIIEAPAKLNLFLEVTGRRADGYHDLLTIMQTVSIYDSLKFESSTDGITFTTDSTDIPSGGDNLVVKAAIMLQEHANCRQGASIHLTKRIPVGAGMGGGSSDAAAALVGLSLVWDLKLTDEEMHGLASRLGSDVAFFLHAGTAVCRGRGEQVTPLDDVPETTYVVVYPNVKVSTKEVYENLVLSDLTNPQKGNRLFIDDLEQTGGRGGLPDPFNRLESVTLKLHEPLAAVGAQMRRCGLETVMMTGSGSAFFGIANGRKEAGIIADKLMDMGVGKVFVARNTKD